jgi:hypothetical protein
MMSSIRSESKNDAGDRGSSSEVAALREALGPILRITDDSVIERLLDLGVTHETVADIFMAPLVEVAWADGRLDAHEATMLLAVGERAGLDHERVSARVIEPRNASASTQPDLLGWKAYIHMLSKVVDGQAIASHAGAVLGQARSVARAGGGLLGLGEQVSIREQQVLEDLERTFAVLSPR